MFYREYGDVNLANEIISGRIEVDQNIIPIRTENIGINSWFQG